MDDRVNKIVDKVLNQVTECHFDSGKQAVCSPKHVIDHMKSFAEQKGVKVSDHPTHVINGMKEYLNCKSESCILKRPDFVQFAKNVNLTDVLNKFFKPEGPAMTFDLLSNFNIDDVLDQFEQRFKERKFLHIPFQMRDFEKIGTQLATIDLAEKLRSEYQTFGVVLNTDWSSGKGIHWFCIFGERYEDKIILEYFNSSGKDPLPEVQAWLQKTKHHLTKELKIPVTIYYSTGILFQQDEYSCGVYCLAYIWLRLERVPPQWFKSENFNDSFMNQARKNMFRWEI